jgi:hypothetical protein
MKSVMEPHLIDIMNNSMNEVFRSLNNSWINPSDYFGRLRTWKGMLDTNPKDPHAVEFKVAIDALEKILEEYGFIDEQRGFHMATPSLNALTPSISFGPMTHSITMGSMAPSLLPGYNKKPRPFQAMNSQADEEEKVPLEPELKQISLTIRDIKFAECSSGIIKDILRCTNSMTSLPEFTEMIKQGGIEICKRVATIYADYHKIDLM